jgi:glyoxylase-like metal-dependent hydrolase (beta-lactamase superfamily II)
MVVHELGEGRLLIDLNFQNYPDLIGSYLIPEKEGWAVIETGPTTCHAAFLEGLAEAGISPVEVKDVFVTHIHLDHAGGSGSLAENLPNAQYHVHELGLPHMVDTTKLVASASRAWGQAADKLWGAVLPVPASRIHGLHGGERFELERGGFLEAVATPGHARNHVSFYDSALKGIMVGDGAGVLIPGTTHIRPGLPPPELDMEAFFKSVEAMRGWAPEKLFFSHFGPWDHAMTRLTEAAESAQDWVDLALSAAKKAPTVESIAKAIGEVDMERSRKEGEPADLARKHEIVSGYQMAAQGLLRYFTKKGMI